MTIKQKAAAALQGIASNFAGPRTLSIEENGLRVQCELAAVDSLACAFDRLSLDTARLAQATVQELESLADKLSRRLTYLLEPIGTIEIDAEHCIVQMRSKPPQVGEGSTYYELLVRRGGELSLCRYQKQPGDVRQTIPAHVTREVLLRLIDDFAVVAA